MTDSTERRVLIVDDSEFFAEMTAETLTEEHGFTAMATYSGSEALDLLEEEPFDCVVSDYQMPGMNGLEFLEAIRSNQVTVPFILLTGRGDEEIASKAIEAGVADYLLKLEVVEDKQYERLANRIESVVAQHQTQRKYELLVDNSPDAIAQVTADGEILAANPALAGRIDVDRSELVGGQIPDVLPEAVASERLEHGRRVIDSGDTVRTEDEYDGRSFHNIFVPVDVRGTENTFQMISREITERKERERQLERQNERLEAFAGVVSHDLRNPLNVIENSTTLLSEQVEDDDNVDRINRSVDRMRDIIEDVLALARQGQTVDEPHPISLEQMVDDAWAHVDADGVVLGDVTDLRIQADPSRVQALFENLFRNAAEHASQDDCASGTGAVTISIGPLGGRDGFYVEDDGVGIPESERDTVFERGYSSSDAGTGMGLAIVEQVATAHGWSISLAVSDAGGARFEITGVDIVTQ